MITEKLEVPELYLGGRLIAAAFRTNYEVRNYGKSAADVYKDAPTLAQFRHACSVNDRLRQTVREDHNRHTGEFTADFIDYDVDEDGDGYFLPAKHIQRPVRVYEENGVWRCEGGTVRDIMLPPSGWQVPGKDGKLYDHETGFPVYTINGRIRENKEDAIKRLCEIMPESHAVKELSYFWRWPARGKILSPVFRATNWVFNTGPFTIDAYLDSPKFRNPHIGSRVAYFV